MLLIPQIAFAVVFSVIVSAIAVTVINMRSVDLGFANRDILAFQVVLPRTSYGGELEQIGIADRIVDAFEESNTETTATIASSYPLSRISFTAQWKNRFSAEDELSLPVLTYRSVADRYFEILGIPLLRGRTFDSRDRLTSARVAIINRYLAERFWPNVDPVGDSITINMNGQSERCVIVGVVGDVRDGDIRDVSGPEVYLPFSQRPGLAFFVLLSKRGGVIEERHVYGTLSSVDHRLVADDMAVVSDRVDRQFDRQNTMGIIAALLAAVAIMLSVIGIFAATYYWTRENQFGIAVRMACGATRYRIIRWLMIRGLPWVLVSVCVGIVLVYWAETFVEPVLFNIKATDPLLVMAVALAVLVAAMVGAYLPARSAASVNPLVHLQRR